MKATPQHHYLASLPQAELLKRLREISDNDSLLLWEMVGLNHICYDILAGPLTAAKLGIHRGELIGYFTPDGCGHIMGGSIGDLSVPHPNEPPPEMDIIGRLRWDKGIK